MPGIGKQIADNIDEILETGRLERLDRLRQASGRKEGGGVNQDVSQVLLSLFMEACLFAGSKGFVTAGHLELCFLASFFLCVCIFLHMLFFRRR